MDCIRKYRYSPQTLLKRAKECVTNSGDGIDSGSPTIKAMEIFRDNLRSKFLQQYEDAFVIKENHYHTICSGFKSIDMSYIAD